MYSSGASPRIRGGNTRPGGGTNEDERLGGPDEGEWGGDENDDEVEDDDEDDDCGDEICADLCEGVGELNTADDGLLCEEGNEAERKEADEGGGCC